MSDLTSEPDDEAARRIRECSWRPVTEIQPNLEGEAMTSSGENLVYHGYQQAFGGSVIAIETAGGETAGLVRHVVKHSPTGIGSGVCRIRPG